MVDSQIDMNRRALDFFGSVILQHGSETQAAYGRVIKSIGHFLSVHDLVISDLSETMAIDWVVELLRDGLSAKNVKKYLDILASLYNKGVTERLLPASEGIIKAKARVGGFITAPQESVITDRDELVNRFLVFLRTRADALATPLQPKAAVWRDIILFSLLNGAMDLAEVARLTKEESDTFAPESMAIIERNASPQRRKYVFDLGQSAMTSRQLVREVESKTLELLRSHVSVKFDNARSAVGSMWVEMAMRNGATASVALGSQPAGLECHMLPAVALHGNVPEVLKAQLVQSIATAINANPQRWFAMRLRPRVTPEEIHRYIKEVAEPWQPAETFYPLAEISKRIGRKLVKLQKPYIADVLFFKSQLTDVLPLFQRIGDKAWCYRVANVPGAPYASIPQAEMVRFQTAIGEFTPDTEIQPLGTVELSPGDEVVVVGGMLAGQKGIVDRLMASGKTGRTLYKIILQQADKNGNAEGYEWFSAKKVEAHIDSRQLSKAPSNLCLKDTKAHSRKTKKYHHC